MIESVAIDGAELALDDVFAAVTIRHGRRALDDGPLGSTATLTLENVSGAYARGFRVGRTLAIDTTGAVPRFRGRITDAALDPEAATLAVTAVSTLARLSGRPVGAVDWPAEAWSERVARAFVEADAAELLHLEAGGDDPALAARPAQETDFGQYLAALAGTVPAAIADLPDGSVLVQAVSARVGAAFVELDPDAVALAPQFVQADDVANVVRVAWSGGSIEQTDAASIDAFEEREPFQIDTELVSAELANTRAILELRRRSQPEWSVDEVELLELDTSLGIGDVVKLSPLPAAAPRPVALGVIEGWEDRIEPEDGELAWSMVLSLSRIALSGIGATWNGLAALTWNTADAITWANSEDLLYV